MSETRPKTKMEGRSLLGESARKLPFVLFQVKGGLYGVSSLNVREIVCLPKVAIVPNLPPEIRGVINLRGKVMPLIDLRIKLGLPSAKSELDDLIQLLADREQDHFNWLNELEACVNEHRPFKLSRDPHACKFGVWFDQYKTDNSLLKMVLRKMDEPHQRIHAAANEIMQAAERGDNDDAKRLLAARRNGELAELSKLFEEARQILKENHRELAVVFNRGENRFAITIDLVEAVERIPEDGIEPMSAAVTGLGEKRQWRIGKRGKTNETVLLLDEEHLFSSKSLSSVSSQTGF